MTTSMIPKSPLLIWLVFHPSSETAREMAREIHRQLNGDLMVPGLRVPTAFCPIEKDDRPPAGLRLDFAERNFIVPLADDAMSIDDDWCRFVADTWLNNQTPNVRCVPVQLSENAWPLDDRLNDRNFARGYLQPAGKVRADFVVRRIVVELCRYLSGLESHGDQSKAPISLFLSHAKADLGKEPKAAEKLIALLRADQPIDAWVDSGDIATGSKFADEIAAGVSNSSLLVVLTDQYSTREFCREEIFLAKEHQRPIVVLDVLTNYEARAFPYAGNVPCVRWEGDPQVAVDCLLKETLRCLHTAALLEKRKRSNDIVFTRAPEFLTLVGLPEGSTVLYPDPPLGVSESKRLAKSKIKIETPLLRLSLDRSLRGRRVALSMSESTDSRAYPDGIHLEANMAEISRYLLIKGATLVYGGFLAEGGYTQALFELVRAHNSLDGVPAFERIINLVGWPLPRPTTDQKAKLRGVAQLQLCDRPHDIDETLDPACTPSPSFFPGDQRAEQRFGWARGMTEMRTFQADKARSGIIARIVMGGSFGPTRTIGADNVVKERWYSSRIPGVLEEIVLSVQASQPVFLIGAYGGVTRLAIDLLQGKDRPEATWAYQGKAPCAEGMKNLYQQRNLPWMDYPEIISLLRGKGVAGINPYLTAAEHQILFETVDPTQIVELVMTGLSRIS